ncbi:hypothetical protein BDZ45DRAFT_78116 [Acephala macrosclerotiorum]|nr:hypothetical protein BDZ45DRAFT_78116 [Acephala macrosclerotiorum]
MIRLRVFLLYITEARASVGRLGPGLCQHQCIEMYSGPPETFSNFLYPLVMAGGFNCMDLYEPVKVIVGLWPECPL